jgi:hypothetical protein
MFDNDLGCIPPCPQAHTPPAALRAPWNQALSVVHERRGRRVIDHSWNASTGAPGVSITSGIVRRVAAR